MQALVVETGQAAQAGSNGHFSWQGREVKLIDGSMFTMADTLANQEAFPSARQSKKRCRLSISAYGCDYVAGRWHRFELCDCP